MVLGPEENSRHLPPDPESIRQSVEQTGKQKDIVSELFHEVIHICVIDIYQMFFLCSFQNLPQDPEVIRQSVEQTDKWKDIVTLFPRVLG